jgi:TolA-binding protein
MMDSCSIDVDSRANSEIERLRRAHASEIEGLQAQLRYAQLRVQSLEQEMKSVKQELDQKVNEHSSIC